MFVKDANGDLVNLSEIQFVSLLEKNEANDSIVVAYFCNDIPHQKDKKERQGRTHLYFGSYEKCQAYMTELEKELAAFGKLIQIKI